MGLFGFSKKKKEKKAQDVLDKLQKADDLGTIEQILAENNLISVPKDKDHNVFGEDIRHLDSEGNLPWGWISANKEFTDPIESEYHRLSEAVYKAKKQGVDAHRSALFSLVTYMEDVQKLCESKGECFAEWASGHVANPVVITKYKEKLKNIEENYEEIALKEQRTNYITENILPTLRQNIIDTIKSEPGIFQVDLFKRYDADLKPYIHTELYELQLEGLLIKEKEGRRNKLFLK